MGESAETAGTPQTFKVIADNFKDILAPDPGFVIKKVFWKQLQQTFKTENSLSAKGKGRGKNR